MGTVAPYHLVNNLFFSSYWKWYIYYILNPPYVCVCVWDSLWNCFCFIIHANTVDAIAPMTSKYKELFSKKWKCMLLPPFSWMIFVMFFRDEF